MKNGLLLLISCLVLIACKRVDANDKAFLVLRNDADEVLLTEEIDVLESKHDYMVIEAKSTDKIFFLSKNNGAFSGEIELYRFNDGYYIMNIELDRKALGRVKMKGDFSGTKSIYVNGEFNGSTEALKGAVELMD